MRIISGSAKGLKLFSPPDNDITIRPTSDRSREALYNVLGGIVKNALVLDLFAGTGAFGLEAYSRGAAFVVFVDSGQLAIKLLKKNIIHCMQSSVRNKGEIRVVKHDLSQPLPLSNLPSPCTEGFDLIFADPPYSKNFSIEILKKVNNSSLLKHNGLLIIEERFNVVLPRSLSKLELKERRNYGESSFWLYQYPQ